MPADPISTATHLGGALAVVCCAWPLIRRGHTFWARVALATFTASAVVLLVASGVFHAIPRDTPERELFKRLDHAAIFILIAGSFTPLHAIAFRGFWRWSVLWFIWICALVGVVIKTIYFASIPEWLGVSSYVAMGWVGGLTMVLMLRVKGPRFVSPLVLGGLAYTAGALCELTEEPTIVPGLIESHEVFHLAVLVGLGSMWLFMHRMTATSDPVVVGRRPEPTPDLSPEAPPKQADIDPPVPS